MKFEIVSNDATGAIDFSGSFTAKDIIGLRLSQLDRHLMNQPCNTPSEYLLLLEMLYRRHEEKEATPT